MTSMNKVDAVLEMVAEERGRQLEKWGPQNHDPFAWMTILGEEYGETCQEALRMHFGSKDDVDYIGELVQVAAVAVAAIESALFGVA